MKRLGNNRIEAGGRRIKICIVVASPEIVGGHSVQASRLARGLSEEPNIDVVSLWINPRLPGVLKHLKRIKYVRTLATLAAYVAMLLIRLRSVDVVHVFAASYWSFLLGPAPAVIIGRLYRKPVVLNYHSGEARDHLARWRRSAIPIMRLANMIVVPSPFLVEVFAGFNLNAVAVANTVDPEVFRFKRRDPLGATVLCNRNLEPNYDVACTLRAFALIQKEAPCARLIVAGDGSQSNELRRLAIQLGLRNVEFIGGVDPKRMPEVYDRAHIFVNSSIVDCMPLSILEAFACGLPVVTTCSGGIPYIVRHNENGLLVEPGDYEQLARGILSVLGDANLANHLIEGGLCASTQFTWVSARPHWLAVYQGAVEGRVHRLPDASFISGTVGPRSQEAE
jgi:glycosyltransferase involved in cell wall biosynthesis